MGTALSSCPRARAIEDCVIDEKHQDGAEDGHHYAVETWAHDRLGGELLEQESTQGRPYDAQNNVGYDASSLFVHDPAGNKARDQTHKHPSNNRH